jgi:hypothetical protein
MGKRIAGRKKRGRNKGNSGEIDTGVPYQAKSGCTRRQPVGGVRAAAPVYHYTLDHLLLQGPLLDCS